MKLRFEIWMEGHEWLWRALIGLSFVAKCVACWFVGHKMDCCIDPYSGEYDYYCERCENRLLPNTLKWWLQDQYYRTRARLRGEL